MNLEFIAGLSLLMGFFTLITLGVVLANKDPAKDFGHERKLDSNDTEK